eukprot:8033926-Alexandrium_andersonii.AAC.1
MEDIRRVLDHWKQSLGEKLPGYNGAWWGQLPPVEEVQRIRAHLSMPPLDDPQFAGILHGEEEGVD